MKKTILFLLLLLGVCFAGNIPQPPVDKELSVQTRQYLKDVSDNFNVLEITTTAPNGNIRGKKGQLILYNNSGTYSIWANTDGKTTWQSL